MSSYFKTGKDTNQFKHIGMRAFISNPVYLNKLVKQCSDFQSKWRMITYFHGEHTGVCHGIALSMCYGNQGYIDFDDISEMENMDNWHTMIMCSEEMKNSRHFCVLPAGKYLCAYFKDYTADRDLFIKMFLEYVKFNDIKLKGIMIQQFKIDVTVTDDPKETIIEFQALV